MIITYEYALTHQHDHYVWIRPDAVKSEVLPVACEGSLFVVLALCVSLAV